MFNKFFLIIFLLHIPLVGMDGADRVRRRSRHTNRNVLPKIQVDNADSSDDEMYGVHNEGVQEPLFVKVLDDEKKKLGSPPEMEQGRITRALLKNEPIDFEKWKKEDIEHRMYDKQAIEKMVVNFKNRKARERDIQRAKKISDDFWNQYMQRKRPIIKNEESIEDLRCLIGSLEAQEKILKESLNEDEY